MTLYPLPPRGLVTIFCGIFPNGSEVCINNLCTAAAEALAHPAEVQ